MAQTIGILGTGDMGSAVARVLRASAYRVVTALDARSPASRRLAEKAGLEDLGSLPELLRSSDIFLAILPPAAAYGFACEAAAVIASAARELVYVDCNAVAPATVRRIAALFADGPAAFVDAGIVGPPPKPAGEVATRFYVSGPSRSALLDLHAPQIGMVDMGESIGRASAVKICYAAMNKGVDALYTNVLLAARRLDVDAELWREFETSQSEAAARMRRRIPFLAATAERYTGEMAEIAASFEAAGVSGDFHRGAEWVYRMLARSALAGETRASLPAERSLDTALAAFAAALDTEPSPDEPV